MVGSQKSEVGDTNIVILSMAKDDSVLAISLLIATSPTSDF